MTPQEIEIVKAHAKNYCFCTKLPKTHKFYKEERDCGCVMHELAKELGIQY